MPVPRSAGEWTLGGASANGSESETPQFEVPADLAGDSLTAPPHRHCVDIVSTQWHPEAPRL